MTVLILGGSGFLGRAVVDQLRDEDTELVTADVDVGDVDPVDSETVIECDVTKYDQLAEAIERFEPTRIVHLAYIGASSDRFPSKAARVNCVGVDNVLRAAVGYDIERVAYASSGAVYGGPGTYASDDPVDETTEPPAAFTQYPLLLYTAMKHLNEYQSRLYADRDDLSVAAVRPAFIFGPGYEAAYTQWASDLVEKPLDGEEVTIPFPPDKPIPLVYRDDAARLFVELLFADDLRHHSYNTGGYAVTPRELAETVEREIGGTVTCLPGADPAPFVSDMSHERAQREFGFELPSLPTAVRRNADAVRSR